MTLQDHTSKLLCFKEAMDSHIETLSKLVLLDGVDKIDSNS